MVPIVDEPFVNVQYDSDLKLITVIWKDAPFTEADFKDTYTKVLQFGKNQGDVQNFMADVREQLAMSPDERKWFQTDVIGQAVSYGLKRAAVVFSGSVFKKFYLNNIFDATKKLNLPLKFFYTREDAIEWLNSESKKI